MADYIDTIVLSLDGNDLDEVIMELEETDDAKLDTVQTINKTREGRGFKQSNDSYSLSLKCEPIHDPKLGSWNGLKRKRKEFTITKREAGATVTWSRCRVSKVVDNRSSGGSGQTVSVTALHRDEVVTA